MDTGLHRGFVEPRTCGLDHRGYDSCRLVATGRLERRRLDSAGPVHRHRAIRKTLWPAALAGRLLPVHPDNVDARRAVQPFVHHRLNGRCLSPRRNRGLQLLPPRHPRITWSRRAKCSKRPRTGWARTRSQPSSSNRLRTSGNARTRAVSRYSFSMIAGGVLAGANRPCQTTMSKSKKPD